MIQENIKQRMENKGVSIILGSYNRLNFLKITIKTIREELENCKFPFEIIVIDGGSLDGSLKWLIKQKDIIAIVQHNRGFWKGKKIDRKSWGYFMNLGFKIAKGKYICMVSDDCLIVPGAIKNGIKLFENKLSNKEKIGAIAFYFRDWPFNKKYHVNKNFEKIYVNHGLYLKDALKQVEYIDEENYLFYGADIDLCMKLYQAGYDCVDCNQSFIEHYYHANKKVRASNDIFVDKDTKTLQKKWEKYGKLGGSQVFVEYKDKYQTAKKFWNKFILKAYLNTLFQKINEKR